ncbi:hypothetical protein AVEN_235064-1 [Araneus ventricosus]|uniref:Uncharacterized protein n=1 Tax=Araneus ventricosus TaxID=182803 RepID=A0A4Y2F223_ARAVE|nr:hypothetical protein AVEN_235064-1 [Araneus ventricosus]
MDKKLRSHPPPVVVDEHIGRAWWMPEETIQPENTTNILTGPTQPVRKFQPEGIDSRGTSCRNNREPVVIILCPGTAALARSCGHRKPKDLHHGVSSMPQRAEQSTP